MKIAVVFAGLGLLANGAAQAVTYFDGVSPALSLSSPGTFDLGTHLPSYIGGTTGSAADGTNLDGARVFFFDATGSTDNPADATPFNLLIWKFGSAKDSLRLYTHQDHYFGGPITTSFVAQDVMEYSVFGCNGSGADACKTAAEWTLLSDATAFALHPDGKPTYTFAGTAPTSVYRGGSDEFGILNAYTRDYTFGASYNYFGMRATTISFLEPDADPELDAVVAFNRRDFPPPIPEPGTYALIATGLMALGLLRIKRPG